MRMEKKGGELICMRPDSIIEARFKLTKRQNDILDIVFANIEDDDKLEYEIGVNKYIKLYNDIDKKNIYKELSKAAKTFEGKGFALTTKNDNSLDRSRRIYFSWFASIEYLEGKIKFELGQKLKTILLEVKRAAYYNIKYTLNFNSIYSKRLYLYLKLYEDTGKRTDNLDVLREKLECPTSYKNYADFNRFVLKPAYEEINSKSDISFEYNPYGTGRKYTHIDFFIKTKKKRNNTKVLTEPEVLGEPEYSVSAENDYPEEKIIKIENIAKEICKLCDNKINLAEAISIYGSVGEDIEIIKKSYDYCKDKNVNNFVGYMIKIAKAIKDGTFNEPRKSSNSDGFNNFAPRKYSKRYAYLVEQCLLGQATNEEKAEYQERRDKQDY